MVTVVMLQKWYLLSSSYRWAMQACTECSEMTEELGKQEKKNPGKNEEKRHERRKTTTRQAPHHTAEI